jgi:hypothetical protein
MFQEIQTKCSSLDVAVKQLKNRGVKLAESERDYKIALRSEILKLRDDGQPVTIVLNLAYGTKTIAELRMQRDIAEAMYKSALEYINVVKLQIRILENQYDKEWGNTK